MIPRYFAVWVCVCFLQLVNLASGGGLAGCLEKIWLWRAYNIVFASEGPKQQVILPIGPKTQTKADSPTGQLDFQEFMIAITRKINFNVQPPATSDDVLNVAQQLVRYFGNENVNIQKCASNILELKGPDGKPLYDGTTGYWELIRRLQGYVQKAVKNTAGGNNPALKAVLDANLGDMQEATGYIRRIRMSENDPHVAEDVANAFPDITVKTETATDEELGLEWTRLDISATIAANPSLTDERRQLFRDWVANYGSLSWQQATEGAPDYTDPAITHYDALQTWKVAQRVTQECWIDNI